MTGSEPSSHPGAALRRYVTMDSSGAKNDIVWGYAGGSHKKGGQGDVLIPFPGRIKDGRYAFEGCSYQLEQNDKEGPNAIHGFVRNIPWTLRDRQSDCVEFEVALDATDYASRGYPFSLNVRVTYRLQSTGLSCGFAVRNAGARSAPVGIGFHPYFSVGTAAIDEAEARIPAASYLEFDDSIAPPAGYCQRQASGTIDSLRRSAHGASIIATWNWSGMSAAPAPPPCAIPRMVTPSMSCSTRPSPLS